MAPSRVVHITIDPDVPTTTANTDEEGGEADPDKIITNARLATPSDGLLTTAELIELYATPVRSAYDEGLSKHRESTNDVVTYNDRVALQPSRRGANEPEWTSYTHFWKAVLGKYTIVSDSPPSLITQLARLYLHLGSTQ